MTTSRINAVAIALSIAFGFVGGAGSTQDSAKDQNLSGKIASSKRMADQVARVAHILLNAEYTISYPVASNQSCRFSHLLSPLPCLSRSLFELLVRFLPDALQKPGARRGLPLHYHRAYELFMWEEKWRVL
jgi:hypothetical protein